MAGPDKLVNSKVNEGIQFGRLPERGAKQAARREHGGQYVQTFSSCGFDEVALPTSCPNTSIEMNLGECGLVNVGQHHGTRRSLLLGQFDRYLRVSEDRFISFFE